MKKVLVIGAGPAGLMAAKVCADAGHLVTVVEAKPSVGRKFLMAGKSGLNLTKAEPMDVFLGNFHPKEWVGVLSALGPADVAEWADDLGQELFTGSSGRVFPKAMKASPLLREWLARLNAKGVSIQTKTVWQGWDQEGLSFVGPDGPQWINADAVILALGGASWPQLGSTGSWAEILAARGVDLAPFQAANMGFNVSWSDYMEPHFGTPLKPVAATVGDTRVKGEMVISKAGFEGSLIYSVSHMLRDGLPLYLDLAPDRSTAELETAIAAQRAKASRSDILRKACRFGAAKIALFNECAKGAARAEIASFVKALPISIAGPRPIEEAISTAGGVKREALNDDLMLHDIEGVFCAGEMLDWEAPTGGYLITGCLATGLVAGRGAVKYLGSAE